MIMYVKNNIVGKDMFSLFEWNKEELIDIIKLVVVMKMNLVYYSYILSGKILGMIFDKFFIRIWVFFEVGIL